jgi:hypothetical protein
MQDMYERGTVRCVAPMLTRAGLPGGCRPACRSSIIDETNALLCRPLGALYSYIQNARIGVELEDRDVPVPITALNTFTCNDLLLLSRKSRRFDRWFAAVSWIACPPGNKPRGNLGGRRQPCFWISASYIFGVYFPPPPQRRPIGHCRSLSESCTRRPSRCRQKSR